jgi:predicted metal-binding transcription factor (methanogenesis marker protein 9)
MMREQDDKSSSLKLTTSEIVDLRRTIKMLQSENAILRKKMGDEETIELQNLVAKEISHMTNEELKSKIVKIAQAYRAERLRNEEFERALKSANVDLAHAKQMQTELENL